jgi:molybdopterin-synthase adenylyltransferase
MRQPNVSATEPRVGTLERYARQAALGEIGRAGQEKLADSTAVIVGCGALGSIQAELLARAGVGKLILVDRDILELHNLQRQLLFDEQQVHARLPKAVAAAERLRAVNSEIAIEGVVADVTAGNVEELIAPADLILDGADNFETRYLLNDAAVKATKPWIYGGVIATGGAVMAVRPGAGPCVRCVFPDPPDPGQHPTCETQGVLNTAVAWVAALQSTEALKVLVDAAEPPKLYSLDIWRSALTGATVSREPECVCCGQRRFQFLSRERGSAALVLCGRDSVHVTPEPKTKPNFADLRERLAPLGEVTTSGLVLEFTRGERRLVVFADGRVLVMGTSDPAEARSLVAKYIGS